MDKKLIVIVDTDEDYLAPLEYKLMEEWGEKAEIEIITQLKYFHEFFSQPRNIFLLVINEFLFNDKILKQNCRHVFILHEDEFFDSGDKKNHGIYKYSSVKEIYAEIMKDIRIHTQSMKVDSTKIFAVYSASGGSGKTLAALGVSSALADLGKRVLYINTEYIQDFNYYLEDKNYASPSFCYAMGTGEGFLTERIMQEIGKENFEFLRPFQKSPLSYQVTEKMFLNLAEDLVRIKKYDAIVLELSRELTREKLLIMEKADKMIAVCLQSEDGAYKLEKFMENINWNQEKWIMICNRYKKEYENALSNQVSLGMYSITEYIPEKEMPLTLEEIREQGIFDTTAYLLD